MEATVHLDVRVDDWDWSDNADPLIIGWRPPAENGAGQPSEASTAALATDEPISSPPPTVGVEELIEALRPFAAIYAEAARPMTWKGISLSPRPDDQNAWGFDNADLTWGDFRKAQAILHRLQGGEG